MFIVAYSELPKLETKRISFSKSMVKQEALLSYNEMLLCYQKEWAKKQCKKNYTDSREINGFWGFVREWLDKANKSGLLRSVRFSL